MSQRQRRISLLGTLSALATIVATAAVAWACTADSYVDLSSTTGKAGDTITVNGKGFVGGAPVEIRWDGTGGPLMGTGQGPRPTVNVTIPDVPPGTYYVFGIAREEDGSSWNASRQFTVVGPEETVAPAPAPAGDQGQPAEQAPAPSAPAPAAQEPMQIPSGPAGSKNARVRSQTSGDVGRDVSRQPSARRVATTTPVSDNPAVVRTSTGQRVFGSSASPSQANPRTATPAGLGDLRGEFAAQTAPTGETSVWKSPSAAKAGGADPSPRPGAVAPDDRPVSRFVLGLGLLGVSLIAMLAGFLVAAVRRGRVPVRLRGEERDSDH